MGVNIKILSAACAAVINLGLIIFISLRNRHHTVYKTFILISFCLLMWNLRVVIANLVDMDTVSTVYYHLINRIFFPAVAACLYMLPVFALHFAISFLGIKSKAMHFFLRICYFVAFLLIGLYISNILPSKMYGYLLETFMLPLFIISLFLIGRAHSQSQRPLERARINLLFIGGVTGVAGAFAEDVLTASGIHAFGIGNVANVFYSLLVAVCLFRHRLFDVKLTLRRLTGFIVSLLVLIVLAYVLSEIFNISALVPYGYLFIVVTVVLIFGNRMMSYIERTLSKQLKFSAESVVEINSALEIAKNTDEVFNISHDILKNNLALSDVSFYLYNEYTQTYSLVWPTSSGTSNRWHIPVLSHLVMWFKKKQTAEPFIYDEVQHFLKFGSPVRLAAFNVYGAIEEMERMGYEVCVPMILEETLEGMIFTGSKTNGRAFSDSDVRFMKLLAHTSTLWLQRYKMLDRLRHLEQIAALGEMAAYVAHEVKNPLAIIRSSAQLMSSKVQDDTLSNVILDECDTLNRVVTTLLDFTKSFHPHSQKVNLEKKIHEYVDEILSNPRFKNVEITMSSQKNLPEITFDLDHLRQIIMNLLLNATEAMKGKGKIVMRMEDNKPNGVRLSIQDNGPGIMYKDQTKIFELFYSTKPAGTGLGLPITRKLLELNNARMKINSKPHQGCEVIIEIPYWQE